MVIKYVGAKPIVSSHGVSFDDSKADRYTFLNPAIELLEGIDLNISENGNCDLKNMKAQHYSDSKMLEMLKKNCSDLESLLENSKKKSEELIKELENAVEEKKDLSSDDRRAWLGNIKIMKDYYLQFIVNETAYRCLLGVLADKITRNHIKSIEFPLYRNYGMVLSHLTNILRDHKPPVDTSMELVEHGGQKYGRFHRIVLQ